MTRPPYLNHGREHRPGKSDPVPGVIVYDYDNVGDWLYVKTTDFVDSDLTTFRAGIVFDADGVGITNAAGGGGNASLVVQGGDAANDVSISFGGLGGGSPFFLDGNLSLSCDLADFFDFAQADGSGNNAELSLNGGAVSLTGTGELFLGTTGALDIVSSPSGSLSGFPVDFGAYSVQIAAGDASNFGTVILEAFDRQATPAYTEFFVGYVDFTPHAYTYNGQTAQILGGQTFTIVGSDGSPIFQVKAIEQGGTVHIKTGTTVHADL